MSSKVDYKVATGGQVDGLQGTQVFSMVDYRGGPGVLPGGLQVMPRCSVCWITDTPQVSSKIDFRGAPSVQGGGLLGVSHYLA